MTTQHCGKLTPHEPHRFWARPRASVVTCVCDQSPCVCPEPEQESKPRQRFSCSGKITTEGAPAHMPVNVDL